MRGVSKETGLRGEGGPVQGYNSHLDFCRNQGLRLSRAMGLKVDHTGRSTLSGD